jgi:hypothetical protein
MESDGQTIRWQGYIMEHTGGPKDLYLLVLYEWRIGQEDRQGPIWPIPEELSPELLKRANLVELVPSESMAGWRFYDSQEEMNSYYRDYTKRKRTAREAVTNWLRTSLASRVSALFGARRQ